MRSFKIWAGSQYDARSCIVLHRVAKSYCKHAATQHKDRPKTYSFVRTCVDDATQAARPYVIFVNQP